MEKKHKAIFLGMLNFPHFRQRADIQYYKVELSGQLITALIIWDELKEAKFVRI